MKIPRLKMPAVSFTTLGWYLIATSALLLSASLLMLLGYPIPPWVVVAGSGVVVVTAAIYVMNFPTLRP